MSRGARSRPSNFFPLSPFTTLHLISALLLMLLFNNVLSSEESAQGAGVEVEKTSKNPLFDTNETGVPFRNKNRRQKLINITDVFGVGYVAEERSVSLNASQFSASVIDSTDKSYPNIYNQTEDMNIFLNDSEPRVADIDAQTNNSYSLTSDSNITRRFKNEEANSTKEGKIMTRKSEGIITSLNLLTHANATRYDNDSITSQRTTERANLDAKLGESPFLGFVGSQKFPIRPTYKPLPAAEKFDRRHFGLTKPEAAEDEDERTSVVTLEPDLPKSPSRDVNYNQKIDRKDLADEDYTEANENQVIFRGGERNVSDSNVTTTGERNGIDVTARGFGKPAQPVFNVLPGNASLPGTSPGLRALGVLSNGSFFDGRNETLPGSGAGSRTGGVKGHFETNPENLTLPKTPNARVNDYGILRDLNSDRQSSDNQFNSAANGRTYVRASEGEKINVTILGLFELTQGSEPRPEGLSELQAARLAVQRINEMGKIPKFRIHLAHNDTKCYRYRQSFYSLVHNMSNIKVPTVRFYNGKEVPIFGLGTWKSKPNEVTQAVKDAIDIGYRHIDCATFYENEKEVGAAIQAKIAEGVVKREDLFIVGKLWCTFHRPDLVEPSLKTTLSDLGLEYIDLYLIHFPVAFKEGDGLRPTHPDGSQHLSDVDYVDTWKAMEAVCKKGLTKSIGVSNFNSEQIERLLTSAEIPPVTNQIECHPYLAQLKLSEFCRNRNILVTAYSPLGSPDSPYLKPEDPELLNDSKLQEIAKKYKKTLAQIVIRYQCDPGVGVDRFFHALYSRRDALMPLLLGTACSEVTETLAKIVPYWSIAQVSFGSTAPALSDATEFPLFRRTVAPDSSHNPARIALIKHLGWDTVTALSQNGDMYSLAVNDLVTELEQANITCTATITFAANDYKEQLRTLKELDTRIIIASFSPVLAPRVFCEAWKLGMHGGDYAWILPGDAVDLSGVTGEWWHTRPEDCSSSELASTLDGLVIVKSHTVVLDPNKSDAGWTTAEFTSELATRGVTLSRYAAQTFDAVWAMALALSNAENHLNERNKSMTEYTHGRRDLADHILRQMSQLKFMGVSGPVSFKGADRIGISAFYQMHGHTLRRIAIYTPTNGSLTMTCAGCAAPQWPGEHPPAARRVCRLRVVTVTPGAFLAVTCLASFGATLALAFLAFNLHFRKHKSIKLSSPKLNNIAAVGCALVYGAVILLGLDDATLSDSDAYFPIVCTARVYLLSAGFSLAFGSMFTKTYRVHRIFTRSRSGVVKNKLLQDTQLISLIFVLLLIDGLVVTLWVTLDPMQRHLRNLTLDISLQDRGVVYQPQVEVCRSQHTNGWLGALYAYKGLLLVVGVYMAWETRHVKIPALNDSQYIGMSVYSVVITSVIVVVLANLMSDRATLAFVTITALILASTTSTLALLFLPQLANILAGERADPVVQSLGLKIECNTRRFVTDDRRELQYRVEVQNRVYRKEMAQLELELARLEKQLGEEPPGPSQTSSNASIPQRNPSIGGGLPLLLLSVLPPVIPRASWPSADPSGMRRGTVAFSSQPDLEDGPRRSLADIYKLHQRRDTEGPNRLGVFHRLFSLFGSRPNSRKTSTASFTGVASALRVHMGYIAGLVPGTKAASTCQVDSQGTRPPHPRCGSGPIISITSEEDRRLSLGLQRKECSEPRVNFTLPPHCSTSQSSSREKIRGSPRFPHRIVPANSLGTLSPLGLNQPHRWRSMEVAATTPKPTQIPRGASLSPNCDVWATSEVGIPLSELANSVRGRKPPETLALTIPAVSDASPDSWLGSDLRMLFKENSGVCMTDVSPEVEQPGVKTDSTLTVSLIVSGGFMNGKGRAAELVKEPPFEKSTGFPAAEFTSGHQSPKIIIKATQDSYVHSGEPLDSEGLDQRLSSAENGNGNEGLT